MSGRAARWCWTAWAVAAAAAAALTLTGATTPLRPVATWLFLALGPGWAFVGGARPAADPLTRVTVALGLSIAIDITVAQGMLLTDSWSPRTGLLAVLAVCGVGLALHARRALRLRRTRKLVGSLHAQLPQLPSPTFPAGQPSSPGITTANGERGTP